MALSQDNKSETRTVTTNTQYTRNAVSDVFDSEVRSYCRSFPETFDRAEGELLFDLDGGEYLEFPSGCGSLNYGHNHPVLQGALLEYIHAGGVSMSMDLTTRAKSNFIEAFARCILEPRGPDYRLQFPGPTRTNAIEAAIKLARKATGRHNVLSFTNGFHGCSLGALALTGNRDHRGSSMAQLNNVSRFPFDKYVSGIDSAVLLETMLDDPSGGLDKPAAIILETIQGEGGLNTASAQWAQAIQRLARRHGALLIVDDIQAGWPPYCAWWIEEGHQPNWPEACRRLEHLADHGPTPQSFDLINAFDPDGQETSLTRRRVEAAGQESEIRTGHDA